MTVRAEGPNPAGRLVIDPVARVEGQLRIEAGLEGNTVTEAWVASTLVRGIEIVLRQRDPRDAWAFAQRVCGACTLVHGIAAVHAVEHALGLSPPPTARRVRRLMLHAQRVVSHVMHFYRYQVADWVDPGAALSADPGATSRRARQLSPNPRSSPAWFADARAKLRQLADPGTGGPLACEFPGHPAYRPDPETSLMITAHCLEALAWQREISKLQAILGGKSPHPNLLAAGTPFPVDRGSELALNAHRLEQIAALLEPLGQFVKDVYLPDVLTVARAYPDGFRHGEAPGNFLTCGEPGAGPARAVLNHDLAHLQPVDLRDPGQIREHTARSWYEDDNASGRHPFSGATRLAYTGPAPPYEYLDVNRAYSWGKAPRWRGRAMETGPLARVVVGLATGDACLRAKVDAILSELHLPRQALFSALGRTLARTVEALCAAESVVTEFETLAGDAHGGDARTFDNARWDPSSWPKTAGGIGFLEAPGGALVHWLSVTDGVIANYQIVGPDTWNTSPRDASGQPGPLEAALKGLRVRDPHRPLEILRTVRSVAPCMHCAAH